MYNVIAHTADIGLELEAPDAASLMIEAARGWKYLVFEDADIRPRETKKVSLSASSLEELLVDWLSELNFYLTVNFWVFCDVENLSVENPRGEWRLESIVTGEALDAERHYIYFDIKAVTFHQLKIEPSEGKLRTRVFFDI